MQELSVFSANVWGLKGVSKKRKQRIAALALHLKEAQYDIICLQELFQKADFKVLSESLTNEYTCVHQSGSGLVGSGLAIFTKLPVREGTLQFVPFRSSGPMWRFWEGDWFAGKGAQIIQVLLADGQSLTVANTHLQAGYGKRDYNMIKALQLLEITKALGMDDKGGQNVLLAGDLNTEPGSLPWNVLLQRGNWRECNSQRQPTSNVEGNSFRDKKAAPAVIDHILFHGSLQCIDFKAVDTKDDSGLSLSDHVSLQAKLSVLEEAEEEVGAPVASLEGMIELCELINQAIKQRRREKLVHMATSAFFLALTISFAVAASVLVITDMAGAAGLTAAMAIISPLGSALSILFAVFALDAKRAKALLKDQLQEINFESKA